MTGLPGTLYGVYKRATEQMASRYLLDEGLPSIGLRPHTVFGPARDQGLTSAPTTAMLAAAAGRAYEIPYGGHAQFQYAPDVARAFVQAALAATDTAAVYNLAGTACSVADVVDAIVDASPDASGLISFADTPPGLPGDGRQHRPGRGDRSGRGDSAARGRRRDDRALPRRPGRWASERRDSRTERTRRSGCGGEPLTATSEAP